MNDTLFASPDFHLPPENRDLGVVFQNYALWPHMTVAENVGYSLKVSGVNRADREERIRQALALVDLLAFADRRPADLSGGQRQRVALARCLVAKPPGWSCLTNLWLTLTCICVPPWKRSFAVFTVTAGPP